MIFGIIKSDDKVFTGDSILIDVSKSFLAPNVAFTPNNSHEISVDEGVTWYDISSKKQVNWLFSTHGVKTITLRLNTVSNGSQTFTKTIEVLNITTANLFSKDNDLYSYEPDIDNLMPKHWSSWNMVHLEAQSQIVQWLDRKNIRKTDGTQYVVSDFANIKQVREWSQALVLSLIYEGNSNQLNDVFKEKAITYRNLVSEKMQLAHIELTGESLNQTINATTDLRTVTVVRG